MSIISDFFNFKDWLCINSNHPSKEVASKGVDKSVILEEYSVYFIGDKVSVFQMLFQDQ